MSRKKQGDERPLKYARTVREALENRNAQEAKGEARPLGFLKGSPEEFALGKMELYLDALREGIAWKLREHGVTEDHPLDFGQDFLPDPADPIVRLCAYREEVDQVLVHLAERDIYGLLDALADLMKSKLPTPDAVAQKPTGRPPLEAIQLALWMMRTSRETTFEDAVKALPDGHSEPLAVQVRGKTHLVYRDGKKLVQVDPDEKDRACSLGTARNYWTIIQLMKLFSEV